MDNSMPLHALPESRRDAVQRALREVFGKCVPADPMRLSGGVSGALIIRFQVQGWPYVLRVEPERIAIEDRRRGFACMAAAAGQGVAPRATLPTLPQAWPSWTSFPADRYPIIRGRDRVGSRTRSPHRRSPMRARIPQTRRLSDSDRESVV
jgi:hypothetical protein